MAINQGNIPVTVIDGGMNIGSALAIDPKYTPNCSNIVIHDGIVKKRGGFVYDHNEGTDSVGKILTFYHYTDYENGITKFLQFGQDATSDPLLTGFWYDDSGDPTGWTAFANLGDDRESGGGGDSRDFLITVAEVVEDSGGDGNPDDNGENLIISMTPTDPTDIANGVRLQKYNLQTNTLGNFAAVSYSSWGNGVSYKVGTAVTYNGNTYVCIKRHISVTADNRPSTGTNWQTSWSEAISLFDAATTDSSKCKAVVSYFGRLVLFGVEQGHKIRWSKQWDYEDFNSGGSGWFYTYDTGGTISTAELLRDTIICYKTDSIWTGTRLTSDPYIRFTLTHPDVGVLFPRGIGKWGNLHFVVGTNNFYLFGGGSELIPVGDKIWNKFLADLLDGGESANQLYRNRSFVSVHNDTGDIAVWIPSGTSRWPNKAYVFNMFKGTWTIWDLPTDSAGQDTLALTGWGNYEQDATVTDTTKIPFYGRLKHTLSSATIANPRVLKYVPTTFTDNDPDDTNGSTTRPISAFWTTKTFVSSLEEKEIWQKLSVEAKGQAASSTIIVSLSTDDGQNFKDASGANPPVDTSSLEDNNFSISKVKFNIKNYSCQFKISDATSAKGFEIRSIEVKPSSSERAI
jgi:hypothetical protein